MTSMSFNQIGPLALPLSVKGVDDNDLEGHVSREILRNGTKIILPYWSQPVDNDQLLVFIAQNGVETTLYDVTYPKPLNVTFLEFDLTPQHLATDGIAQVYYKIWKGSGGTDDDSPKRQLTIDHTPLITLPEPWFRHATLWGYLNNNTIPPLTSGATVVIFCFMNIALPGDVAKVHWRGYSSLNGSGPEVPGTYGVWDKPLSATDIANGFDHLVPYLPHISLLFDNDSAVVACQLYRGGRLIAESKKGLVKIDRVTPGESGPSGLNEGEREMTVQEKVTFKARAKAPRFDMINANGALATAVSVDKLADDSIPLSVLATGKIPLKLERFDEELDDDDLDIYASVVGVGLVQIGYVPLGPIADRTDPIIVELDASQFLELPQPATPTQYQVQVIVYKGGGGTDDPSNVVTFSIDRTAPFEVKYPSRRKNPPSPAPSFVNAPADTQRLVNEAWMRDAANANLNCTVNVAYPLRRLDDELTVNLTSNGTSIEVFKGTVPATGVFAFANTELRKLPNGRVMITYLWKDLPGNISAPSVAAAFLTLGLALDPKLNKPPLVPVTDPDGTTPIYLDDFFADIVKGIVERVPIDNLEPGDTVKLFVEDALDPTNFVEYGPLPITNADVPFPFSYEDFATLFGTSTEAMEVKAWAEVVRGANSFPSPELFFWMNLYPPGGIYPELPKLTNPGFVLPVVTGASNTPNQLLPGDRDKPGKFTVTLALLDLPITPAETVKCYINDVQVGGDYTPFVDATEIKVDIPAVVIFDLTPPTAKAHWTRQKTGIDKNVISSNPQTVAVGSKKIDLLTPAVKVRNPELKNQIDCFAMINATTAWQLGVLIPEDLVNLPIGKDIVVHFAAYKDLSGSDLIPGTEASTPYTIKAAVKLVVTPARTGRPEISFMGNHAGVGEAATFKLAQPKRGETAFGKYWYTADIGGEQTSIPITMPLDSITSSGEYCDRLPVPAAV